MEIQIKKCSSREHKEIDAKYFCKECKVFLCNKCDIFHSNLFQNHRTNNIDSDNIETIFTGFCQEKSHNDELEYYCKTHNILCCAACIAKIKKRENGKHKDCDIYIIEDIKEEKKNMLKENIQLLESLSTTLENSINNLKIMFEQMNKNKENLKMEIQQLFTKIRNELNNREEKLLFEVDKIYEDTFFKEELIKKSEKMPNTVKLSIEEGKKLEKGYNENENKLSLLMN